MSAENKKRELMMDWMKLVEKYKTEFDEDADYLHASFLLDEEGKAYYNISNADSFSKSIWLEEPYEDSEDKA